MACMSKPGPGTWLARDHRCSNPAGSAARLSTVGATNDLHAEVELALCAGHAKGRQRRHLEDAPAQIRERVLLIDRNPALARLQAHPRDRVLAPTSASVERLSQS